MRPVYRTEPEGMEGKFAKGKTLAINDKKWKNTPLFERTSPIRMRKNKILGFLFQEIPNIFTLKNAANLFWGVSFFALVGFTVFAFCAIFYSMHIERL